MHLNRPPYGINFQSKRVSKENRWDKILNDKRPFIDFIPKIRRVLKPTSCVFIFTRWDVHQIFIDTLKQNGLSVRNVLIWDKMSHGMGDLKHSFSSRYESIIFCSGDEFRFPAKRPEDIISCRRVPHSKMCHPNEKPVELLKDLLIKTTQENDVVLDLFMGSGSTGMACKETNRRFIGVELDNHYFDIAKERLVHEER